MTANFDRWAERVDFLFGMDANAALVRRAEALEEGLEAAGAKSRRSRHLTEATRKHFQTNEKERSILGYQPALWTGSSALGEPLNSRVHVTLRSHSIPGLASCVTR